MNGTIHGRFRSLSFLAQAVREECQDLRLCIWKVSAIAPKASWTGSCRRGRRTIFARRV